MQAVNNNNTCEVLREIRWLSLYLLSSPISLSLSLTHSSAPQKVRIKGAKACFDISKNI